MTQQTQTLQTENKELSIKYYLELLTNSRIAMEEETYVFLDTMKVVPKKTIEEAQDLQAEDNILNQENDFRIERNKKIEDISIEINKLDDVGGSSINLRNYRQALRDAPQNGFVMPKIEDYI